MKRIVIFAIIAITLAAMPVYAQKKTERTPEQRQQWLSEIRSTRHEYLAKELSLSSAQRKEFFALYDEMDDQLTKINEETRDLERRALTEKKLTDTEYESIARSLFEQKARESEIEQKYFAKFKEILRPQQLVRIKNAERRFTQSLLRHQRRAKEKNN